MHNPFLAVQNVKESLFLASLERIPAYLAQQRQALRTWFDKPHGPLNDPLVEFDLPFEHADLSWDEIVQAGMLCPETLELLRRGDTIKSERPYRHQWEAIQAARQGKSLVVSAGTGSGKTECFLIPILDDLLREAMQSPQQFQGLRSLLVYPLNALVFDQMGRWRAVLRHQRDVLGWVPIRISMYNAFLQKNKEVGADLRPTFQALGMREDARDLRPYLPMEEGEITDRAQFLAGGKQGANLVITNYVMLELALLRDDDQRWLSEGSHWRHVVLDEAHTYTGGLAVDIALLLRRLRDRIAPAAPPQGFATSATFGGKRAQSELAAFSSVLFGLEPGRIEVLQGQRVPVRPDPAVPADIRDDYASLIRFLASQQEPERLRPLIFPHGGLAALLGGGEPGAERLDHLLARCSESRDSGGHRALLPHRLHAVLRRPIPWSSQCINPQCGGRAENDGFQRWLGLGWIGQDPSDDLCPRCHGPMLLPVTCGFDGCAQEGLLARASFDLFPPTLSGLHHPEARIPASGTTWSLMIPKDDWPQDHASTPVALEGGRVREVPREQAEWVVVQIEQDDEGKLICPRCGQPGTLKNTWSDRFPRSVMDLVAMDRLTSLQVPEEHLQDEPSRGRRILSFADSRQGAARLAPRLAFTHRVLFVRRWMIDVLDAMPAEAPQAGRCRSQLESLRKMNEGGLMDDIIRQKEAELASLEHGVAIPGLLHAMAGDAARLAQWAKSLEGSRFQKRFEGGDLLPKDRFGDHPDLETAWYGLIRGEQGRSALGSLSRGEPARDPLCQALMNYLSQELLLAVLRELCRPSGRTPTALKLGIIQLQWPRLSSEIPPLSSLGIPKELHQEFFERTCHLLLEQRCLELPDPFTGREEDWGAAHITRRATLQESANEDIFSFASDRTGRRRFTACLDLLAESCLGRTDDQWTKRVYVALWEMLRRVAKDVPMLRFSSDGDTDYIRIKADALQVTPGTRAFRCKRCGAVSHWGGLGRCAEQRYREVRRGQRPEPCGADLEEVDLRLSPPTEASAYPHAWNLLKERPAPEGLSAFEHTAQRGGDKVRRDELLFRRSLMNVLCSSTTLEMGVDLPDLDTVVLMGVPPAAANHTQRVGRAGRSRKRSCLALTLAGEDSFDRWAHRDLAAFLKRPGVPPRVDLDREEKLRQHFFAWRLGLMVRRGSLVDVGKGREVLNRIAIFAGIDPDLRRTAISGWNAKHPDEPWQLDDFAPGWGDEAERLWEKLDGSEMARGMAIFGRTETQLRGWLKEGRQGIAAQLKEIRKRVRQIEDDIAHGSAQQEKFMRLLLFSLRNYDALKWLAENQLLPRFSFPVSNVSLSAPADLHTSERIDRDRRQAVMEWTPGAPVVVANRLWTVKGLAPDIQRGRSETHHRLFTLLQCRTCGHQHVSIATDLGDCPVCGSRQRDLRAIATPYAFASEPTSRLAGMEAELPGSRASRILTLDDRQWPEGAFAYRPSVPVAFLNLGLEENGYWLCSGCGRLRNVHGKWKPCCEKDSRTEPDPIVLGEVVRMDVLRIRPAEAPDYEGLRATAQALRLSAAFLLELDPRSLTLADILEDGLNSIYLVDLTDGGSGLLARLKEPGRCRAWLELAHRILSHRDAPAKACANACPECILTHDNRTEHRRRPFRRLLGLPVLDRLLEGLEPGPESTGATPASTSWTWQDVAALTVLDRQLILGLQAQGLPVPEVGRDLVIGPETVGTAELCWPGPQVALVLDGEDIPPIPGWNLIRAAHPECVSQVVEALRAVAT